MPRQLSAWGRSTPLPRRLDHSRSAIVPASRRPFRWVVSFVTAFGLLVSGSPVRTAEPDQGVNRLSLETSLYLRMHAHNPVDWYPWGEEALAKARQENKLIFLSIGYSSCYWCHVMERESFMDQEIAKFLNEHFVCIKVDREERPDVDSIYMMAVQLLTRQGGWPLSAFLTPEGKPFFGGTYFPARDGDRGPGPGFLTVVRRVHDVWQQDAAQVRASAERLTKILRGELQLSAEPDQAVEWDELATRLQAVLADKFDPRYGGFGFHPQQPRVPKFPQPSNLWFLLDRVEQDQDQQARQMLTTTLDQMAQGGIWDHLAGGFHRYSTDRYWEIPHFEKMLYDNAQLASVYARAFQLTGQPQYRQIASATVDFVLREMTSPEGAFYSAIDAENDGIEGKYYRWTDGEIQRVLGSDFELFSRVYGLDDPPNFEEEFYVLRLKEPLDKIAGQLNMKEEELEQQLATMRNLLLVERKKRAHPLIDTKVLTSWNGMMIRGLADAGRILEKPEYVQAAERAADFLLQHLRAADGRLLRTYSEGQSKLNGYLDDYALLVDGLLGLHQATGQARWLDAADELTRLQLEFYQDEDRGGFYFTASDHEELIVRLKQFIDEVIPAGNSVAVDNLLTLAQTLDRPAYEEVARRAALAGAIYLAESPVAVPRLVVAAGRFEQPPNQ